MILLGLRTKAGDQGLELYVKPKDTIRISKMIENIFEAVLLYTCNISKL